MKQLLYLLKKYADFLLFLALEIVATIFIINQNHYQKTKLINSSNKWVATLLASANQVQDYFKLNELNAKLADENAQLRSLSLSSFEPLFGENININDTTYFQEYTYLGAKVISNSVNKRNNYITINKGSINGVAPEMGVISSDGVVGIVQNVSEHYATVMSILHVKTLISAKLKQTDFFGSVTWNGSNYRFGKLNDIPSHVSVHKGDTVVTSGFSYIFPENIPIAVVEDFSVPEGENFYSIKVKFTQDFKRLGYVYVVKNLRKTELKQLEQQTTEEEALPK